MRRFVDVEALAESILVRAGYPRLPNGIAIDVEHILRDYCGFDVAHIDGLKIDGRPLLGVFVPSYGLVMVEANCIASRKRFSMAHELGHAEIEHRSAAQSTQLLPQNDEAMYFRCDAAAIQDGSTAFGAARQTARPLSETIADKFAAALLMPKKLVLELWRKRQDVESCAEQLAVSRAAMLNRIEALVPKKEATPFSDLI